jgi:hypothetical protein
MTVFFYCIFVDQILIICIRCIVSKCPFTTPKYLQLLLVLGDGICCTRSGRKYLYHLDCIRFGLHHEQYLVLLTWSSQ